MGLRSLRVWRGRGGLGGEAEDRGGEAEGLRREEGQEARPNRQDQRPPRREALGRRDKHGHMLKSIKTIEKDGLVWGANKLVPVGYGINKLQVMYVVEDEKVSIDELCEQICEFEDFVQSCDVSAMSKI